MANIKLIFYIVVLFMCSCGSPRFAKDGIFVNDVDEYFNPRQDINVWVYGNFHPYIGLNDGLRLNSWYEDDKDVLKKLNLNRKRGKVLFSAIPSSGHRYHLIAIQHNGNQIDFSNYEKNMVDSSYYFQKDYRLKALDIRHILIPYGPNKALSLVYYIDADKNIRQPFAKLDYLARINTIELQKKTMSDVSWRIFDCMESKQILTTISLNTDLLKKHKRSFLKIYADYGTSRGIQYFQILDAKYETRELVLKLCPERYIIELSDAKQNIIQSDSLIVK